MRHTRNRKNENTNFPANKVHGEQIWRPDVTLIIAREQVLRKGVTYRHKPSHVTARDGRKSPSRHTLSLYKRVTGCDACDGDTGDRQKGKVSVVAGNKAVDRKAPSFDAAMRLARHP